MSTEQAFRIETPSEPWRVVRGRVTRPAGAPPGRGWPWVLVLHGFKGFMDWGFFPTLARALAGRGMAAVAFNTSGSGVGDDLESCSDLEAFRRDTLSRQLEDVERVRQLARTGELGPLDAQRAGVFGHSRGGGVALVHAAETPVYRAVATWAALDTFDRWDEATKRLWRQTGTLTVTNARTGQELPIDVEVLLDFERNRQRLDILDACRRIQAPVLLVHGTADEAVHVDSLRRLAEALPPDRVRTMTLEGAGHTLGAVHPLREVPPPLARALETTLGWFEDRLAGSAEAGAPVTLPGPART